MLASAPSNAHFVSHAQTQCCKVIARIAVANSLPVLGGQQKNSQSILHPQSAYSSQRDVLNHRSCSTRISICSLLPINQRRPMMSNPLLDLQFQRNVSISPEQIWDGWTHPATLMEWFCPRPWKVVECDIDLRPGGIFRTVMQSPEGQRMPDSVGTFLAVEPPHRLVWTNALGPDFRLKPQPEDEQLGFFFVVDLRLERLPDGGTSYTARVMHQNETARQAHEAMGFQQGWGIALDQLIELMR